MKRVLPAIALIAGLSLAGCSSGGTDSTEAAKDSGGDSASQPPAEEAPQATQLDKDQLKKIIDSADVDGTTFKSMDAGAAPESGALGGLDDAEFEPAKCKSLANEVLNATLDSEGNTASGMSSDSTLTAALMSFPDESGATDHLKTIGKITDSCSDITVKMQGMEMKMSYKKFDAPVTGADVALGLTISMETDGQSTFNSDSVTARVGNNIVNTGTLSSEDDTKTPVKVAETFVESFKNAS